MCKKKLMLWKKAEYGKLVKKVNNIKTSDTSDLVKTLTIT